MSEKKNNNSGFDLALHSPCNVSLFVLLCEMKADVETRTKSLMVTMSCVCCRSSGAVGSTGGVVHEARPGAERGERPQGGVGRRSPPGAQHVQRRRSRVAAGSAGEEEDVERGGGERVEGVTPHTGYMQKKKKKSKLKMNDALLCKLLPLQHLR